MIRRTKNFLITDIIKDEIVIGLNKIYLLFPKIDFRPTYIVCYVPNVVEQAKEEEGFEKLSRFSILRFLSIFQKCEVIIPVILN